MKVFDELFEPKIDENKLISLLTTTNRSMRRHQRYVKWCHNQLKHNRFTTENLIGLHHDWQELASASLPTVKGDSLEPDTETQLDNLNAAVEEILKRTGNSSVDVPNWRSVQNKVNQ